MKNLKKIIAVLLILCLSLSIVACGGKDKDDNNHENENSGTNNGDTSTTEKTTYTVKLVGPHGEPISGARVYIHKGAEDFGLVALPVRTDAEGIAVFELDTASDYSIQLDSVSAMYVAKAGTTRAERYDMGEKGATIVLARNPDYVPLSYKLGDKMTDFTLVDIDGNEYNLTDLLKEKDMVMLNFWFYNCNWCTLEFPAINSAYSDYSDKVQILALNDYSDALATVKKYESDKNLSLDFPLFKVNASDGVSLSQFGSLGYPTTVIIDRTGTICLIEVGAITSEALWQNAFAYFTAENYETNLFEDISDIPKV